MNVLVIGRDKTAILDHLPKGHFLIIDDGPIIDALTLPARRSVTVFDPAKHSFNPLKDMSYRKARDFIAVLDAVFPEGESTLTKRYSNFQLLTALLSKPKRLSTLVPNTKDTADAHQKIQTLLLSPVLERVLNRPTNLSFRGSILARLNRAELGDFDCFVIANLLASQYPGPVVIPDFGFYACKPHLALIRQDRLVAGVHSFEQVPAFKNDLILIEKKVPCGTTPKDAELLAIYAGHLPGTNAYHDFIESCLATKT